MLHRLMVSCLTLLTLMGGCLLEAPVLAVQPTVTPINLSLGKPYRVLVAWPDPLFMEQQTAYPDTNHSELTDGIRAGTHYADPAWQVFTRQGGRTIELDLGRPVHIERVAATFLQNHGPGVYVPRYVDFAISLDGEKWVSLGRVETTVGPWNRQVQIETFSQADLQHLARYVRLRFPVDVLVMIDEVEVTGTPSEPSPDAIQVAHVSEPNWSESAMLGPRALPPRGLLPAGTDQLNGAHHIVLATYAYPPNTSDGEWSAQDYLPYVAYVSEQGEPIDWMFDTILLSPQGTTPTQRSFAVSTATTATSLEDWVWYIDETFRPNQQLHALEQAAAQAKEALGEPDYKVKVMLTLINPSPYQRDFGAIEPGAHSLNFDWNVVGIEAAIANRLAAVRWLIDQFLAEWAAMDPEHLELSGFWWHPESIGFAQSPHEDVFVKGVADLVHAYGYPLLWIPFYGAPGSYDWHNYGFDAAILQPNYMFSDTNEERLRYTADIAHSLGMGIEMEKHWRFELPLVNKWIDYLAGGAKYGYDGALVGYYQGFKDFGRAATVQDQTSRRLFYDHVYDFIKGRFVPPPGLRR